MNWEAIIWLCMLVFFLIVEGSTVAMVSLWFAVGSLVCIPAALLGMPFWGQLLLFLGVSGVCLALLRPFARKYFNPKVSRTNVEAVVGTTGYVKETIDNVNAAGRVKLGSVLWTARSTTGAVIPEGTLVRADKIEGVKVFVSPAENQP